jgi:hypothetical protein
MTLILELEFDRRGRPFLSERGYQFLRPRLGHKYQNGRLCTSIYCPESRPNLDSGDRICRLEHILGFDYRTIRPIE